MGPHKAQDGSHRHIRGRGNGVTYDAAFEFLDPPDLVGLTDRAQIFVDNTQTAFLCQADRGAPFGHRIHSGRQDWDIEPNTAGKRGLQVHIAWQNARVVRE